MKKLYVGNLKYSVDDLRLEELFKSIGDVVSAKVITDYTTGQSKGFGFVEMELDADADKAIEKLNNVDFDGRYINVDIAKPKIDRR